MCPKPVYGVQFSRQCAFYALNPASNLAAKTRGETCFAEENVGKSLDVPPYWF